MDVAQIQSYAVPSTAELYIYSDYRNTVGLLLQTMVSSNLNFGGGSS